MKKKIIFVINSLEMGGEQKATTNVASELQEKFDVKLINFSGSQIPYFTASVPIISFMQESKLHLYSRKILTRFLGNVLKREVSPFFLNRGHLKHLINYISNEQPEVVILVAELPYYSTVLKSKFPKIKVIIWLHNPLELYHDRIFRFSKKIFIESMLAADSRIVLTKNDVSYGKKINLNCICIYNPMKISNDNERQYNKASKTIAVAVRYNIFQKGLDFLPSLVENLPKGWCLQIAGSGTRNQIKKLKKLFYKVDPRKYMLLGSLDEAKMVKFYSDSSFYLMTSRFEGLPLVLIEAMKFGLPVLSFANSGAIEITGSGKWGRIVEIGNMSVMRSEIDNLIRNPKERDKYSALSIRRAQDFSTTTIISKWELLLNEK